jgi:DNA-binding PadR family transcriptional regulator
MTLAAALTVGTAALAQAGLDPVLQALERQGYAEIEVQREQNLIRIEARNRERLRVLVYDRTTGALISDTADQDRLRDRDRLREQDGTGDQDRDRTRDQDRDRVN